jgi:uncharacterized peroxidase-related enzyme
VIRGRKFPPRHSRGARLAKNRNFTILRGRGFREQPRKPSIDSLFGNGPLGTKGVFASPSNRPRGDDERTQKPESHPTSGSRPHYRYDQTNVRQYRAKFGVVPNLFRVLGNAPAALEAYINFGAALSRGTFDTKVQELIGLTVAESNLCDYCLNAHISMARKIGLSQAEIAAAIRASAADGKTNAILKLARSIIVQRGEVADADLQHARGGGLTDCEIVETVANVVFNIFMNYLDHVARPTVDFPRIKPADRKEPT